MNHITAFLLQGEIMKFLTIMVLLLSLSGFALAQEDYEADTQDTTEQTLQEDYQEEAPVVDEVPEETEDVVEQEEE